MRKTFTQLHIVAYSLQMVYEVRRLVVYPVEMLINAPFYPLKADAKPRNQKTGSLSTKMQISQPSSILPNILLPNTGLHFVTTPE